MDILFFGVILVTGYFFSLFFVKIGFPKIVGYLVAGIFLNPSLFDFVPQDILNVTDTVTEFCLAFITFEIGSSFSISELKKTGTKYFKLAFYESFSAFLLVLITFFILSTYFLSISTAGFLTILAFVLLLSSLAAPTDPSATLAVIHEYKADGPVSKAILGAAAFDDIVTLFLFSFSISIARSILGTADISVVTILFHILYKIIGAVVTGVILGIIFQKVTRFIKNIDDKALIILFLGFLSLTFGLSKILRFDELFSTLTLGFVVGNFDKEGKRIIDLNDNKLEDLFFLLFFVFSAMSFNFHNIEVSLFVLILIFIVARMTGKYLGMFFGARVLKMDDKVKKYAFGGLIPQGGIVLGLSLMIAQEPEFKDFSNLLTGIIMGATIIHEFVGPLFSRLVLKKSQEI